MGVHARGLPQALLEVGVGHAGVAPAAVGQRHLELADDALVGLLARSIAHREALLAELAARAVLVAGDDGRAVEARVLSH